MEYIRKRDGKIVAFDASKIIKAVQKASRSCGKEDTLLSQRITDQVETVLEVIFKNGTVPTVENVQDLVEKILIKNNEVEVAKAYILYRDQRAKMRATKNVLVDVEKTVNEYLSKQDWRVNANSNQGYSLGGLILNTSGKVTANYWLSHIYSREIGEAHRAGDFHIHDLDMFSGYCAGWSLRKLLEEGFGGVPNKVDCDAPRNLSACIGQMVNFLGTLQNEWAGAQAFSSFDTYLAPYVRKIKEEMEKDLKNTQSALMGADREKFIEEKTYEQVKQCMQQFVFNLNVPSRWGTQCVDEETECLTEKGWKRHDSIEKGEKILTFNTRNNTYEYLEPLKITAYDFKGKMYVLKNRTQEQWITPRHKVLRKKFNTRDCYELLEIEKVTKFKSPVIIPNSWETSSKKEINDNMVKLFVQKKRVPDIIKTLSLRQIRLFLETYLKADGSTEKSGRSRIYAKDTENLDRLQELCALAGYGSTVYQRKETGVNVLNIIRNKNTYIQKIERKFYKGKVWCPTTRNGTFVARRKGKTFITGNTPFTNITLDWVCPEDLKNEPAKIGNEKKNYTYGDCQKEMDMINKAFIEIMMKGDSKGRVFTFPIPTYNITKDFNWDHENCEYLFEMTAKYGMPYFQNFINSELKPNMIRSMCCRLQLDLRELLMRGNGLFGSAEMTGSVGVVTINAARLGHLYKGDLDGLKKQLENLMDLAKESLEMKRKVVQQNIDNGLLPYTKRYLGTLGNHFSTIGINGINECIRNFTGDTDNVASETGIAFAENILDFMREKLKNYQEETGNLYNLEATPAEGTTYRFAKEDQKRYPDILQAGTHDAPYYTNSSQLPVSFTADAFEALTYQDRLQRKYTGGTVLHLYMGERITNAEACKKLVKRALSHFRLPYITITPTFSICPKHGYLTGEHPYCPKCDEEIGYRHPERTHEALRHSSG